MTVIALRYARTQHIGSDLQATFVQATSGGPVTRRPLVLGARGSFPGEVPVAMQVTVYRRGHSAPVGTFDQIKSPQFQDVLSEAGAGSVVIANDDPDLAWVTEDSLLMFELHGWAAFTLLPRQLSRETVPAGEEAGALTTIEGAGNLGVLEEAVVYPARGLDRWPIEEDRLFSWPSVDYRDEWWTPPITFGVCNNNTTAAWSGLAGAMPAPAEMLWAPGTNQFLAPGGNCYFRHHFHWFGERTKAVVYFVADDEGDVYLDGEQIGTFPPWKNTPEDVQKETVDIDAGDHTIAVRVRNSEAGPMWTDDMGWFNPAQLSVAIFPTDAAGNHSGGPITFTRRQDWIGLYYPPNPPGMTPGEAMIHCIREAQDRGCLADLLWTFDEVTDSGGAPWPIVGDIATKVGYDMLTFFRELAGAYTDMAMAPGSMLLYAWSYGERGEHTDVQLTRATGTPESGNVGQMSHRRLL
jgi:hypothetical protein